MSSYPDGKASFMKIDVLRWGDIRRRWLIASAAFSFFPSCLFLSGPSLLNRFFPKIRTFPSRIARAQKRPGTQTLIRCTGPPRSAQIFVVLMDLDFTSSLAPRGNCQGFRPLWPSRMTSNRQNSTKMCEKRLFLRLIFKNTAIFRVSYSNSKPLSNGILFEIRKKLPKAPKFH